MSLDTSMIKDILPEGNTAERFNPRSGGADREASVLREQILNAADTLRATGVTYYISPDGNDANDGTSPETAWKTIGGYQAHLSQLQAGDAVLFARESVFRGHMDLVSGVSYGAYGTGRKPAIYGSAQDVADSKFWHKTDMPNIWLFENEKKTDVGVIVFDHGYKIGVKQRFSLSEVTKDLDFFSDREAGKVYLYCEENPAQRFKSIEICDNTRNILQAQPGCHDVVIENLTVKYGGSHGMHFTPGANHITIRNCEIGWIGGCVLTGFGNGTVRFGNAIEFWNNCSDILIENNWVYQVYDAGITHQGDGKELLQKNITYRGNLVEYCTYGFEFFLGGEGSKMQNILYEKNIVRFSGYGWGLVRPNPQKDALMCGWGGSIHETESFVIQDNIFDSSDNYLFVQYHAKDMPFEYRRNAYYQTAGRVADWFRGEQIEAYNQQELESAISRIDATPALVKFLE